MSAIARRERKSAGWSHTEGGANRAKTGTRPEIRSTPSARATRERPAVQGLVASVRGIPASLPRPQSGEELQTRIAILGQRSIAVQVKSSVLDRCWTLGESRARKRKRAPSPFGWRPFAVGNSRSLCLADPVAHDRPLEVHSCAHAHWTRSPIKIFPATRRSSGA